MNNEKNEQPALVILLSGTAFFYFLIFAQFGYLHRLVNLIDEKGSIDLILLSMGLGGVAGCIFAMRIFRLTNAGLWLLCGFSGATVSAVFAGLVSGFWLQVPCAFVVGFSLGSVTVCIVPMIRVFSPVGEIGKWVGIGVGSAYFLCNIPPIFKADPWAQCLFGGIAACLGAGISLFVPVARESVLENGDSRERTPAWKFRTRGVLIATLAFAILIWYDSAEFFLMQETLRIREAAWSTSWQLWSNAVVHLIFAVIAGRIIDKGWIFYLLLAALVLLVGGSYAMNFIPLVYIGNVSYLSGVSAYSTALVSYGALAPEKGGNWRIISRAGIIFAGAGWICSAMGIGMARDLGKIPVLFTLGILVTMVFCMGFMQRGANRRQKLVL